MMIAGGLSNAVFIATDSGLRFGFTRGMCMIGWWVVLTRTGCGGFTLTIRSGGGFLGGGAGAATEWSNGDADYETFCPFRLPVSTEIQKLASTTTATDITTR